MKLSSVVGLLILGMPLASGASCTGPQTQSGPGETPEGPLPEQSSVAIATDGDAASSYDAPPHRFTPSAHPPRVHQLAVPVNLHQLPRMVNRTSQCLFQQPHELAGGGHFRPFPGKQTRARSGSSWGGGGVGMGRSAPTSKAPRPARRPVARTPSPAAEEAAPSAPPPPQSAAPRSRADNKAHDARKKEAAKPKHDSSARRPAVAADMADAEEAPVAIAEPQANSDDAYHDWGAKIYLSNDDTMSLSSAQRVIWAIDHFEPLPAEHIRPHELLNYFSFDTDEVARGDDFSVQAGIEAKPGAESIYTLGFAVAGRAPDKQERRNAALTFVIDRSGSMSAEGRMEYLQQGLLRMTDELKQGDLVNLVYFDHNVCVPLENFVVGRDPMNILEDAIRRLRPLGSTDLFSGLKRGYELADRSYQDKFTNRVVMITDALANTGVTNSEMISMISKHFDKRRIRLSGVGVGRSFNDELLDRLTEQGKGAYVFLGSEAEVDAVFGARFTSLIETVANDVHFRLHLPPSLRMNVFYGEESSTVKEDVQAVHYFAGTSQLFLSDLMARGGALRPQDDVMLSVEYEHPETGQKMAEEFAFNLGQIAQNTRNVRKGRLIMSFVDGLKDLALSSPSRREYRAGGWIDEYAYSQCEAGRSSLAEQAQGLEGDREVQRVNELWDKYCSRYEQPSHSIRRETPRGRDVWPSAQ